MKMNGEPDLKRAESLLRKNRLPKALKLCQRLSMQSPADYKPGKLLGKVLPLESNVKSALTQPQQTVMLQDDTEYL